MSKLRQTIPASARRAQCEYQKKLHPNAVAIVLECDRTVVQFDRCKLMDNRDSTVTSLLASIQKRRLGSSSTAAAPLQCFVTPTGQSDDVASQPIDPSLTVGQLEDRFRNADDGIVYINVRVECVPVRLYSQDRTLGLPKDGLEIRADADATFGALVHLARIRMGRLSGGAAAAVSVAAADKATTTPKETTTTDSSATPPMKLAPDEALFYFVRPASAPTRASGGSLVAMTRIMRDLVKEFGDAQGVIHVTVNKETTFGGGGGSL